MDTQKPATAPKTDLTHVAEDFISRYANHVVFETSLWDLKLIFGQLDQRRGSNNVDLHTAITIPWPQVKVLTHLLRMNLAIHENTNGNVMLMPGIIPDPLTVKEYAEKLPNPERVLKTLAELNDEFFAANPEAATQPAARTPKPPTREKTSSH